MTTPTKLYTFQEVSQHDTENDCWIILDGKVYNVTKYLTEHPGGEDLLLNATGRDAIEDFEFTGHSETARALMLTFCIGELDKSSQAVPEQKVTTKKQTELSQKSKDTSSMYWVIPVAIIGISAVAGLLYFPK